MIRHLKIACVATTALFLTLVALGNVTDYGSNFAFVRHVLSMDTVFEGSTLTWRAITAPWAHHAAYWIIILWEAAAALVCWWGAARLWRVRKKPAALFNREKPLALWGVGAGFLLFTLGFITIGGEWFAMWQSAQWNGQGSAHIFLTFTGLIMIFVAQRDEDDG